ncbi:hypothetical protein OGAPHI_006719 [Ogataea philodendri]|uniref:Uncharacterized protein n=1 Tax=Ogataea philodendri TaxID=1378263 RepID=A0A9P8NXL9_9ASCO|nr:uncharacterized protein OGAPHI_006719 [Ogataea philodendri]KAH3661312.1 hypothetical protein OGAPHI_006719 [Ogataea philodendri]
MSIMSTDSIKTNDRLLDRLGLPDDDYESFEEIHESRNYEPANQFKSLKPFWYDQKQRDVDSSLESDTRGFVFNGERLENKPVLKPPQHRRVASREDYFVSNKYMQQRSPESVESTPIAQTFPQEVHSSTKDPNRLGPLSPPPSADSFVDPVAEPLMSPTFVRKHTATGSGSSLSSLIKSPLKAFRGKPTMSSPDVQETALSQHFHSLDNAHEMLMYGLSLRGKDEKALYQSFQWICMAGAVDPNEKHHFHIDPRKIKPRAAVQPQATIYFEIGRSFVHGWGCPKDLSHGVEFLELAATFGSIDAANMVADLAKKQHSKAWRKFSDDLKRVNTY